MNIELVTLEWLVNTEILRSRIKLVVPYSLEKITRMRMLRQPFFYKEKKNGRNPMTKAVCPSQPRALPVPILFRPGPHTQANGLERLCSGIRHTPVTCQDARCDSVITYTPVGWGTPFSRLRLAFDWSLVNTLFRVSKV